MIRATVLRRKGTLAQLEKTLTNRGGEGARETPDCRADRRMGGKLN